MMFVSFLLTIFSHLPSSPTIIDGYTNRQSAFPGESVDLYLNATHISHNYLLRLFDLSGKEVVNYKISVFPQTISNSDPFENGFGYKLTKTILVPELPSGVYMWENRIPFIIKAHNASVTILYSSNTVNAYCNAGGKSLYGFNSTDQSAAQKVSFLRPSSLPPHSEAFLRWISNQKIDGHIAYVADSDMDDYNSIKKSKLLIITGHSEYWTLQARKNYDRFVHQGKNAMILSGNTMWWQVRYNRSKHQLICYRDKDADPIKSPALKTVVWNDPVLQYPILTSTGTDFENAGYGLKKDNGWNGYKIIAATPLLEGTNLKVGDILKCPSDELDGAPVKFREDNTPMLNYQVPGFYKKEIIGFDLTSRGGRQGVATWIVFKPTRSSGIVINAASTDWCSERGIGSNADIQKITATMIRKLLNNEDVFSNQNDGSTAAN